MKQTTANMENVKSVKKRNVPLADINFGNVIATVSSKWLANDWLTLKWHHAAQFQTNATSFNNILQSRLQKGATRPQITQSLKTLDKNIDTALSYVKGYIIDKYKKENATSYYAAFGIEHRGKRYMLPQDQNRRIAALHLMIDALTVHDFATKEYGVAYWTPLRDQYIALVNEATTMDGSVAVQVGDKNTLKSDLQKALNAIINALKANYPDTFKQEMRDWGFQKEKY